MRKAIAIGIAAVMFIVTGVLTLAMSGNGGVADYSVYMSGGAIEIWQNGGIASTYYTRSSALTIFTDKENDLIVQYKGEDNMLHNVSLGSQKTVVVDGSFGLLDLRPTLDSNVWVLVPDTAKITQLAVSAGHVELYGTVTLISAKTTKAHVQVMAGAQVSRVNTVANSAVTGLSRTAQKTVRPDSDYNRRSNRYDDDDDNGNTSSRYRYVDVYFGGRPIRSDDSITIGASSTMGDASRELDNHCSARDERTGNTVSGYFRFDADSSSRVSPGWHSWTFYPRNSDYRRASGGLQITVEGDVVTPHFTDGYWGITGNSEP